MIPEQAPPATFKQAMATGSELKAAYDSDEPTRQVVDLAMALEGLIRNDSIHAAGVVISDEPLTEYIPLQQKGDAEVVTQFGMDDVAALGLLKMDFLGLRNLDVIEAALTLIEHSQGACVDMTTCRSTTPGLRDARPGRLDRRVPVRKQRHERGAARGRSHQFEDLVAIVALYRPGPMQYISTYARNKKDPASVVYDHEALRPILEPTPADHHQEQYMAVAGGSAASRRPRPTTCARPSPRRTRSSWRASRSRSWPACGRAACRRTCAPSCGATSRLPATTRSTKVTPPATR